jgi:predicted negative regulator of RcsB-dependent stress response
MFYNPLTPPRRFFTVQSYTRRQLKEDKFAETAQGAFHWAGEHRQTLIWGIGVLVVVVLAVVGFLAWNSRQTERANIALDRAIQTSTAQLRPAGANPDPSIKSFANAAERGKAAEKEFKAVADQYRYTKPGKIAAYLAGTAAMQAGDNNDAEQQLKAVADSRDQSVAALAKLALAGLYRTTNRPADAAKIYKDLTDHPTDTVSKTQAQLQLADMYSATDPKEAANIYQQIQKDSPNSSAAQIAASKLASIGNRQ